MKKSFIFLTTAAVIFFSVSLSAQHKVPVKEAYKHIGETVTVCGTIPGDQLFFDQKTKNTYLLLGEGAQDKRVTIVIPAETSKKVINKPKNYYANKSVCVTGKIVELHGKPEMVINNENKIRFEDEQEGVEVRPNDFMRFQ